MKACVCHTPVCGVSPANLGAKNKFGCQLRSARSSVALPSGEEAAVVREDVLEELIQQTRSETVGADLKLVAVGMYASFGRECDLCAALTSARGHTCTAASKAT